MRLFENSSNGLLERKGKVQPRIVCKSNGSDQLRDSLSVSVSFSKNEAAVKSNEEPIITETSRREKQDVELINRSELQLEIGQFKQTLQDIQQMQTHMNEHVKLLKCDIASILEREMKLAELNQRADELCSCAATSFKHVEVKKTTKSKRSKLRKRWRQFKRLFRRKNKHKTSNNGNRKDQIPNTY